MSTGRSAARAVGLTLALACVSPARAAPPSAGEGWAPIEGAWSASGRRHTIAVEGGGTAAIVEMSGAVVLTKGEGLPHAFRGEVIGFDDGQGTSMGRCVWTDDAGDRLFSSLKGEPLQSGKRFVGTITGGTGRYAGFAGEYSFTWQYILASEDGQVQSRAVSLSGRVRRASAPE
ncbi:MAG TPA: hypothetical protein VFM88_11860 [Vicinamibacteria bacterium]|nr:hypothetical protein [Vicinamibacteria bacterium]